MTQRAFPRGTIIAAVSKALTGEDVDLAAARRPLDKLYGRDCIDRVIYRLRLRGDIPPRATKVRLVQLRLSPELAARVRAVAEERAILPGQAVKLAMVRGLDLVERQPW